jgi:hypothetical protein
MQYVLPSGGELNVTPLGFEEAWRVSQDVIGVIKELSLDFSAIDFKKPMTVDLVREFKDPICTLLGSPVINKSVRSAFNRATYNGAKIDKMTFDPVEARGDYLFAAFYALKENISPFFDGILSFLKTSDPTVTPRVQG